MNAIEAYYSEGEAKGMEKGMEKGIERGHYNKSVQAIKKMIEKEMSISLIAEVQEVTEEFVNGVIKGTVTEIE